MKKQVKKKTVIKKRQLKTDVEALIEAVLVWHGATVLNSQSESDSAADSYLRKRCVRFLKNNPDTNGVKITVIKP